MTSKPDLAPRDTASPPVGGTHHQDSVLESIGKAITNAVWESSGEADQSETGDERRAAGHRTPQGQPPER